MSTLTLLPHAEKLALNNPLVRLSQKPLYHQIRTFEALREYDVVMNTYNTGTGKTVASLLRLFDLKGTGKNVLFIAPTNALLSQHAEDIERFVADHQLDFKVLRVTAADVRAIESGYRPGETLQRLLRNYLEYEPEATRRQPIILVVNPDIFYYALFFQYGAHDQRNLFERFVDIFDYIVIDEFHYYDSKQLANFLFAMALFDELGYFRERDRKICLLSATPLPHVADYLDRLFPDRWAMISPDNEPPESAAYPTTPTLTSLELTIQSDELQDWVAESRNMLKGWVAADEDGAIISNSLWRVNQSYATLSTVLPSTQMGRITGPEPAEKRAAATGKPLILATPTVDIGYNFKKLNKQRQNVDFLICDARFGDELLQRIGRAGRVLGKDETARPSRAVALLPPEAVDALAGLDGQTLDRAAFAAYIRDCGALPPKHNLTGYIRSWAIVECFYPIFELGKMIPPELLSDLESLFARLRAVFAPRSKRTFKKLSEFFRQYKSRQIFLAATRQGAMPFDKYTAKHMADFIAAYFPEYGRPKPADIQPQLASMLNTQERRDALRSFIQSQVAVTKALFNFRDSFQGPRAVIYDRHHQLSSETINIYDLLHLYRHYHLSPPITRAQFQKAFGKTDLKGDFYFELRDWREDKISIAFAYSSRDEQDDFVRKWCRRVVGLAGLQLQAHDANGTALTNALPSEMITALDEKPIPALILLPADTGASISRLRGTPVWSRRLTVSFPDGTSNDDYRIFTGKAAFEAHAELLGHFLMKDRLKPDVIII